MSEWINCLDSSCATIRKLSIPQPHVVPYKIYFSHTMHISLYTLILKDLTLCVRINGDTGFSLVIFRWAHFCSKLLKFFWKICPLWHDRWGAVGRQTPILLKREAPACPPIIGNLGDMVTLSVLLRRFEQKICEPVFRGRPSYKSFTSYEESTTLFYSIIMGWQEGK